MTAVAVTNGNTSIFAEDGALLDVVRDVAEYASPVFPLEVSMRRWNNARPGAGYPDAPTANAIHLRFNRHQGGFSWGYIVAAAFAEGPSRAQRLALFRREPRGKELDTSHAVFALRLVAAELGRSFRDDEYEPALERLIARERRRLGADSQLEDLLPTKAQIMRLLDGNWEAGLKLAGLEPYERQRQKVFRKRNAMPMEEAAALFAELNGRWPSNPELHRWALDAHVGMRAPSYASTWWSETLDLATELLNARGIPVPTERPKAGRPRKGEVRTYVLPPEPLPYSPPGRNVWSTEAVIAALREWDRSLPAGVKRTSPRYGIDIAEHAEEWPSPATVIDHGGFRLLAREAIRRNTAVARGLPDEFEPWPNQSDRALRASKAKAKRTTPRTGSRLRTDGRRVTLADLVAAGIIAVGTTVYGLHRGTRYEATVTDEGLLQVPGAPAAAPSGAQEHAMGQAKNGWRWWRVEHDGREVWLDELREELLRRWSEEDSAASAA